MKKNVIIGALLITTMLSLLYANVQRLRAQSSEVAAYNAFKIAEEKVRDLERMLKKNELQKEQAQKMYEQAVAENEQQRKRQP